MLQLGVGGIFAILILRLVFDFIDRREMKRQSNGNGVAPSWAREPTKTVGTMAIRVRDLHDWHKPENGEQTWKNKQMVEMLHDLKEMIEGCSVRSTEAINNNNQLLERIIPILMELEK